MIPSKAFNFFLFFILITGLHAQHKLSGTVISEKTGLPVARAEIYNHTTGAVVHTNQEGSFVIEDLPKGSHHLVAYGHQFQIVEETVILSRDREIHITLPHLAENLSEVILVQRKKRITALRNLRKVEGTAIYAGKKSEVIMMDQLTGNLAANNARQIYSQVVGLNIYDNGDAGLQLNIGGRGLDPNRTQNFNTRQNGYDISADVLGYPESYYTPPAEALREIQVVRGAASLQYGTQFGGMINFKFKEPDPTGNLELVSRQTLGSFDLFTSFNSLSGTSGEFSYYTFYNFKKGNAFRPNSGYESGNAYGHLSWQPHQHTKISVEYTWLDYLAQQPGGLTDVQFYRDPRYSNRSRNWFKVNWNLYALKLEQRLSPKTELSLSLFALDADRKAVGYRENRVSQPDDLQAPRELLIDKFHNWGSELRVLQKYRLWGQESVLLLGSKYYQSANSQWQGPGSTTSGPDFEPASEAFPLYPRQSAFAFPNHNLAFFGEHIFRFTNSFSLTPGFRYEYIQTRSEGAFRNLFTDLAGNVLKDETLRDDRNLKRSFVLLGVGASLEMDSAELYGNISQNYRSVTFNDIRVVNPVFQVDPNIADEEGFTADLGLRGRWKRFISFDLSIFALKYNDRIGEILKPELRKNASGDQEETGRIVRFRGNIGDALIYGLETFANWDLKNTFFKHRDHFLAETFINAAITKSNYTRSEATNVMGKEVEFIPRLNLKTGLRLGYKDLVGNIQYAFLSRQFTDATNAPQDLRDSQRGIEGSIPAYGVMDLSLSYSYGRFTLETGINNLLNHSYFTRRATGYPGPGILPAQPRTWYSTLQIKI